MDNNLDNYTVDVYWSEEDGSFLAEMPELPGCMADGQTAEEARHNIHAVAQDWIKMAQYMGREVPQPKLPAYA